MHAKLDLISNFSEASRDLAYILVRDEHRTRARVGFLASSMSHGRAPQPFTLKVPSRPRLAKLLLSPAVRCLYFVHHSSYFDIVMSGEAATAQPGAGWDEAQCTAALAQLERLQQQVNTLKYPR